MNKHYRKTGGDEMNKMRVSLACDFLAFMMQSLDEDTIADIKSAVLFGSVSRGTSHAKSDIDIFVDIDASEKYRKAIEKLPEEFYSSELYKRFWRLLGIGNPIKVIADSLENWPELKNSMIADGFYLYKKYDEAVKGKPFSLITWNPIKSQSKRTHLSKKLYGWRHKKKTYTGALEALHGKRLGANVVMVPLENSGHVIKIFRDMKIDFRIRHASFLEQ